MNRIVSTLLLILALILIACRNQAGAGEPTAVAPTTDVDTAAAATATIAVPTAEPPTALPPTGESAPTLEPAPTETPAAVPLSFAPATYRDETFGVEFDYPADWTVSDLGVVGDRGSAVQFLAPGDGDSEIAMQLAFYRWDPIGNLPAYASHRKDAWTASEMTILSEEDRTLNRDHSAVSFIVRTPEGEEAFFLFTESGDRYLELSGDRDVELLAEIAGTVRFSEPEASSDAAAVLGCLTVGPGTPEWVACNVMDGIRSRNLSALHGYMTSPFVIGYWGSEGRSATPQEITAELRDYRLPEDPAATPLTFTTDRSQFPPLEGMPVESLLGPEVNVVNVIYSEGWGADGQGAALIFIAQDAAGNYDWPGMVYSDQHFDK